MGGDLVPEQLTGIEYLHRYVRFIEELGARYDGRGQQAVISLYVTWGS